MGERVSAVARGRHGRGEAPVGGSGHALGCRHRQRTQSHCSPPTSSLSTEILRKTSRPLRPHTEAMRTYKPRFGPGPTPSPRTTTPRSPLFYPSRPRHHPRQRRREQPLEAPNGRLAWSAVARRRGHGSITLNVPCRNLSRAQNPRGRASAPIRQGYVAPSARKRLHAEREPLNINVECQ